MQTMSHKMQHLMSSVRVCTIRRAYLGNNELYRTKTLLRLHRDAQLRYVHQKSDDDVAIESKIGWGLQLQCNVIPIGGSVVLQRRRVHAPVVVGGGEKLNIVIPSRISL
mmetsp:Transcript_12289/g.25456  ORF Transcript_12289/g.25456 Transcript_12289/m.25456 type:complete len:109 (-) Transcript_12289:81-407(-)